MKYYLLTAAIFITFASCQNKKTAQLLSNKDNQIAIGQIDSLYSDILKESRKIWVYVPESAGSASFSKSKYPVLYLLDGDAHFYSVTGIIQQLSIVNGNTVLPEMIVIGILNTDRTRDFTPTHVEEASDDSTFFKTSGGGNDFLNFIEKELIPYIENKYPVTNYKTFVGSSFGGLAVLNSFIRRPQLFNSYVALDPSLSWDKQVLLRMADSVLMKERFYGKALYIGVANTLDEGMDIIRVQNDTNESTEHIRSILQFIKFIEVKKDNGLLFAWKFYINDDHSSVPLIATYDAFRFLFRWYKFDGLNQFFSPISTATKENLINLVTSHYENVSHQFGYVVLPPEELINSLGYEFMTKMPDKAFALFSLNIQNYPNSANAYNSMGDYYVSQSDTLKAIENFTKALEIGNSPISKENLEKLKAYE